MPSKTTEITTEERRIAHLNKYKEDISNIILRKIKMSETTENLIDLMTDRGIPAANVSFDGMSGEALYTAQRVLDEQMLVIRSRLGHHSLLIAETYSSDSRQPIGRQDVLGLYFREGMDIEHLGTYDVLIVANALARIVEVTPDSEVFFASPASNERAA